MKRILSFIVLAAAPALLISVQPTPATALSATLPAAGSAGAQTSSPANSRHRRHRKNHHRRRHHHRASAKQ